MVSVAVLAHMYVFNEVDVLPWVLRHLLAQGVDVLVSDNWSTDGGYEMAGSMAAASAGRLRVMRWPMTGPRAVVSWHAMLRRVETLALTAQQDGYAWVIHHDADEIRRSARPGERLVDAIARLDGEGYTAIDHQVEVYGPQPAWDGTQDPEACFTARVAEHIDLRNRQIKAWKQPPEQRVDLASTGGHAVGFPGRRVASERLVLKHYPLRSEGQAAQKLAARRARWAPEDRARGWHIQYPEAARA